MHSSRSGHHPRQGSLHQQLVSAPSPAAAVSTAPSPYQQSSSPFRYITRDSGDSYDAEMTMGDIADTHRAPFLRETSEISPRALTISPASSRPSTPRAVDSRPSMHTPRSSLHVTAARALVPQPAPAPPPYTRPRGLRIVKLFKQLLPILAWGATSIGFIIAIAFWKSQVFHGLDDLSHWIRDEAPMGYVILFSMIVITTIPPVPLYSTLIILSGYTFGALAGFILSYLSALTGAILVFLASRYFIRESITKWLTQAATIKRVVRAIEKRPTLLFLIRLAPYPYNVMNCLLAASPTLTFKTYTACTALSLFKLLIHTTIGSSIHSFADFNLKKAEDGKDGKAGDAPSEDEGHALKQGLTIGGIILCVSILVYISYIARKAVDEELDDDETLPSTSEENVAFLATEDSEGAMVETSFNEGLHSQPQTPTTHRHGPEYAV